MELVKFKQDNCTPCKMLEDILMKNNIQVDRTVNLTTASDDELMEAGMRGIEKTPVLLLLDAGEEVDRHKGIGMTGLKRVLTKAGLI